MTTSLAMWVCNPCLPGGGVCACVRGGVCVCVCACVCVCVASVDAGAVFAVQCEAVCFH